MRSRPSLVLSAAFGIAALSLASVARAQVVTFSSGGGAAGIMTHSGSVTLSDDAIRGMLNAHESAVLQPNAENNYVVLVVDANDQYVSSRASKMNVITNDGAGPHVFAVGDSSAARVVVRTSNVDGSAAPGAAAGAVIMTRSVDHADGHENDVMGTGINMADVGSFGLKHFAAGEIATGQLMVSVIKLK